jgi:hypothetical protein
MLKSSSRWTPLLLMAILTGCEDALEPQPEPSDPQYAELGDMAVDDDDELPPEFYESPTISRYYTEAGFAWDYAFVRASMTYFANRATQSVTMDLRHGNTLILQRSAFSGQSHFLPATRQLSTYTSAPVSGECGHTVLGAGQHNAHHEFLFKTGWLAWGHVSRSSNGDGKQPNCDTSNSGGGSAGDEECEICQQWFWVEDGVIVDEWWECYTASCSGWTT